MTRSRSVKSNRKTSSRPLKRAHGAGSSLKVQLDIDSRNVLAQAAELRQMSLSSYMRTVTMAQARREVDSARAQIIAMTPEEQLAFWEALQAPPKLTSAQKKLAALMRDIP